MRSQLLLLLLFFLLCNSAQSSPSYGYSSLSANTNANANTNSIDIDSKDLCQLRLFPVQSFQGGYQVIKRDRRVLRRRKLEKSLQSIGDCCWALYSHRHFKGRPMLLGGHLAMHSTARWGWRRNRIKSVRKFSSCSEV